MYLMISCNVSCEFVIITNLWYIVLLSGECLGCQWHTKFALHVRWWYGILSYNFQEHVACTYQFVCKFECKTFYPRHCNWSVLKSRFWPLNSVINISRILVYLTLMENYFALTRCGQLLCIFMLFYISILIQQELGSLESFQRLLAYVGVWCMSLLHDTSFAWCCVRLVGRKEELI